VQLQEQIIANDPLAPRYRAWLAPDYEKLASVADRLNQSTEARLTRRAAYVNLKQLAQIDRNNADWQEKYARSAKAFGDAVREDYRLQIYKDALEAWGRISAEPTGLQRPVDAYNDHMQIGAAFAEAKDWADAAAAYTAAANIARLNLAAKPAQDFWGDKIGKAARASEAASEMAGRLIKAAP